MARAVLIAVPALWPLGDQQRGARLGALNVEPARAEEPLGWPSRPPDRSAPRSTAGSTHLDGHGRRIRPSRAPPLLMSGRRSPIRVLAASRPEPARRPHPHRWLA